MQTTLDARNSGFLTGLLAERVRRKLNHAFAREFMLWRGGRPLTLEGPAWCESKRQQVVERLSEALKYPGPRVVGIGDDYQMLAVPIAQNGGVEAVAVAMFCEGESPQLLVQTAQLVLNSIQAHDEIERLRQQNEEHLVQATQDLEELAFLRSIAGHLELNDTANGMWGLAGAILPPLCHSIRAENVLLIGGSTERNEHAAPSLPVLQVGKPLEEQACLQLVERFLPLAESATVVRNRLRFAALAAGPSVRNLIIVPLRKHGRTLAWLASINRRDSEEHVGHVRWALSQHEFGTSEASLVEAAAAVLASHAINVQLVRDKEKLVANVVRTLVSAIEAKDNYTRGHSERVALFAQCLGRHLGFAQQVCDELYLTGLVHDVGKIGVGDAVLKKAGTLTAAEYEQIKRHPDEGWAILRRLEQLSYVLPGVLHHHEWYNGSGYPDGLRGEDIPLEARILAVADAYDAMTSDRAYRKGMSQAEAEEILRDGAGSQWDPKVVAAFFRAKGEIGELRQRYRAEPRPNRRRRGSVGLPRIKPRVNADEPIWK